MEDLCLGAVPLALAVSKLRLVFNLRSSRFRSRSRSVDFLLTPADNTLPQLTVDCDLIFAQV